MTTENLILRDNCGSDDIFIQIEEVYTKRVHIGNAYFVENKVLLECENCKHQFEFNSYRRWRNNKRKTKFIRWMEENGFPF